MQIWCRLYFVITLHIYGLFQFIMPFRWHKSKWDTYRALWNSNWFNCMIVNEMINRRKITKRTHTCGLFKMRFGGLSILNSLKEHLSPSLKLWHNVFPLKVLKLLFYGRKNWFINVCGGECQLSTRQWLFNSAVSI